jgi:hypothetical protein
MRRKPVTRDEIRFNGSRITTLPIDSVREGEYHPEPIKALWAPLLHSLNRAQKKDWDSRLGIRKNLARSGWRGGFKAPEPITLLNSPAGSGWSRHVQKPEQRPAQAASARSESCGKPIEAQRSTRRFCSSHCPGHRFPSHVSSSFTLIKGAMIDETYAVFAAWDFASSKKENLDRLRHENFIGASTPDITRLIHPQF